MSAPKRIWLQWNGDADPDDYPDGPEPHPDDVTWSADMIHEHDVEYVRADTITATEDAKDAGRLQAENDRMLSALNAALGVGCEFPMRKEGDPPYWWRHWLQEFAGLEYNGERFQLREAPDAAMGVGGEGDG